MTNYFKLFNYSPSIFSRLAVLALSIDVFTDSLSNLI